MEHGVAYLGTTIMQPLSLGGAVVIIWERSGGSGRAGRWVS